jgi:hypothetical protein
MPAPRRLALTASVALLAALGSTAPALAAPAHLPAAVQHHPAPHSHPAVSLHTTPQRHQTVPLIPNSSLAHLHVPHGGSPVTNQEESANWAGYAATPDSGTGPYNNVSAGWTAPTANCSAQTTYSAFWIGLDGAGSDTVEQTGTSADCSNGSPVYYGWYEMYPNYPVQFNDPVTPGDQLNASVVTDGQGNFTLTLGDTTAGWTETIQQSLPQATLASAEVIAEAPSSATGVLPLTDFGTAYFTGATVNGGSLAAANPTQINMVNNGVTKATTSALSNGTDFSVTWQSS